MRNGRVYTNLTQVCVSVFIQFFIAFSNCHEIIRMSFPVLLSHVCLCLSISSPSYHLVKLSPHHLDPRGGWFFSLLTASCRPQSGSLFNQRPLLSIPLPLLCHPSSVFSGWMCCVRWLAWAWTNRVSNSLLISKN